MRKRKIAVLISGSGSNLQALIDATQAADFPAQIELVISNKPDAYGLLRAQQAKIATQVINHKDYATRQAFDAALQKSLETAQIEIVCLAGFMRLLTSELVNQWQGRMLNIHPSLLPAFKGAHAIADALAAGAKETGCTVHYVVPEMDAGPVLVQAKVAILPGDTQDTLAARIHAQEHIIYPQALKKLALSLAD
ncbi:MAG: phosphoribosylglycinamide formyltransferase [Rickettsiales bacterium]|nr:phosphoribosylglycinamide formyltransferase [Rickettsiales bacterium]